MEIMPVVNQIIMIFLLMGIGLMLRKTGSFTDSVIKGVNALVLNIAWPALMISITQKDYTTETLHTYLTILVLGMVMLAACLAVMFVIYRKAERDMAPALSMLAIMPNIGFFGIPLVEALYGEMGLLYLSAYIIGFNIILWTLGVSLFTGFNLKSLRNLLNPGLIAALIGLALFLLRVHLPTPILGAVDKLAALNTPLSMLILGSRMDQLTRESMLDRRMWLVTAIKLVLMPLAVLLVLRLAGVTGTVLVIMVLGAAIPSAASTQMMTERYGGDVHFTARTTSFNTLCSLLTLPLMLYLAGLFA